MSASIAAAAAAALSEEGSVLFEQLQTLLDSEVVQYSTKDYLSDVVAATSTPATTLLLHKTTSQPRTSTSTSTNTTSSTFSAPFGVVHTNDNNNCKYDGEDDATMFVDEDKENVYRTTTTTPSSLPASTPTFSFPSNSSATTPTPTGSMLAVAAAARTCSRTAWKRKQKAVNWRARVCEWFYQGKIRSGTTLCCDVSFYFLELRRRI